MAFVVFLAQQPGVFLLAQRDERFVAGRVADVGQGGQHPVRAVPFGIRAVRDAAVRIAFCEQPPHALRGPHLLTDRGNLG